MRGKHQDQSPEALSTASVRALVPDAVSLPTDPRPAPDPDRHDAPPTSDRGWAPLLEACLADFKGATEDGDAARIPALIKIVADLALIERGAIRPGSRRAQQALRVGRLSLARRLITRHLAKPALSPRMVANLLGVSVRYLHILFEATGTSFSQTVTAQRLSASRRLLREERPRPIADIALSCGFGSLATFYRIFSTTEGMSPGEFRTKGSAKPPAETALPDTAAAIHLTVK